MQERLSIRLILLFFGAVTIMAWLALPDATANAQDPDSTAGAGQALAYDEAEAQGIDRMLMCPVCPAESIDQAQVELARQMRQKVREMLAQGASRDEILGFFVRSYGTDVLAAPPKSGFNLVAWVLPVVGAVAALAIGLLVIRSMAGRADAPTEVRPGPEDNLNPYLDLVDRDLAVLEGGLARGQSIVPATPDAEPARPSDVSPGPLGPTGPGAAGTPPGRRLKRDG